MIPYPKKLNLAQAPTPFHALDRLSEQLAKRASDCPRIWIKRDDQSGCVTSGNKVRKLEYLLAVTLLLPLVAFSLITAGLWQFSAHSWG